MLSAASRTKALMSHLKDDSDLRSWSQLKHLMQFFILGYLVTAWLIWSGHSDALAPLVGAVFLLGSLFVLKTVQTGQRSISRLDDAVAARTEAAEESRRLAEEAVEARTRFMANVSHEIRTPMNAVIGLTSLLLESDLTDEQREDVLALGRSGNILLRVVTDVLDFAKFESDTFSLEEGPVDLGALLESTRRVWKPEAADRGIELHCETKGDWWPFWRADETRLQQILNNLVANAIRFTDEGSVSIEVESRLSELVLTVSDTGCGMPKEDLEHIFHSFRQSSTDRGGTGLGLAICHRLVEAMDGQIDVQSDMGEGTEFRVTLPLDRADAQDVNDASTRIDLKKSMKVLLVDDNAVNLKVASRFLFKLGCLVQTASHGRVAVEKAEEETYDLILMDCHMPVMNGLEATEKLRQGDKNAKTPVYALTAMTTPEELQACLDSGMDGYITKPLELSKLTKLLAKVQKTMELEVSR